MRSIRACALVISFAAASQAAQGTAASIEEKISATIATRRWGGVSIALSDEHGDIVWKYADGMASIATPDVADARDVPLTTDTKMTVNSHTKTITAIVAMQMVERGLVGLDEDVNDIVAHDPLASLYGAWPTVVGPDSTSVRVVDLLNMQSGIYDGFAFGNSAAVGPFRLDDLICFPFVDAGNNYNARGKPGVSAAYPFNKDASGNDAASPYEWDTNGGGFNAFKSQDGLAVNASCSDLFPGSPAGAYRRVNQFRLKYSNTANSFHWRHLPGEKQVYGNMQFALLAEVLDARLRHTSGSTFDEWIRDHIMTPLGIDGRFVDDPLLNASHVAKALAHDPQCANPPSCKYLLGTPQYFSYRASADMIMTPSDSATLIAGLFAHKLVNATTLDLMLQPSTAGYLETAAEVETGAVSPGTARNFGMYPRSSADVDVYGEPVWIDGGQGNGFTYAAVRYPTGHVAVAIANSRLKDSTFKIFVDDGPASVTVRRAEYDEAHYVWNAAGYVGDDLFTEVFAAMVHKDGDGGRLSAWIFFASVLAALFVAPIVSSERRA